MIQVQSVQQITGIAASAQGTLKGYGNSERVVVVISGLTSETITITGELVGASVTTAVFTGNLRPIDLTTGAAASSSTLGNGSYMISLMAFTALKFTKSSTVETPTITVLSKEWSA